jgi:hypothetical protein
MTRAQRLVPLLVAVVIAVIAVVVLTGGGDDEQQAASTPTRSGTPTPAGDHSSAAGKAQPATPKPKPQPKPPLLVQGSLRTLRFTEGQRIRFRVRARQADEVHVHGYDLMKDIEAGQTVSFSFPASITGIFEIELENAGEQLGSLRVDPG